MQRYHDDLWVMRSQVCGLHICLWVFPFGSHSFHFPNIPMPHRQIKPLFFPSSESIFLESFNGNSLDLQVKFMYSQIPGNVSMMPLTNSHQSCTDALLESGLSFCAALEAIGHSYALKLKCLFPLEEQTLRKPAVRPSCGWKRLCGGGRVATN